MEQNTAQNRKQRTLVIGAGQTGLAVLQAFRRRSTERGKDTSGLACLAVRGDDEWQPADGAPAAGAPEEATEPSLDRRPAPAAGVAQVILPVRPASTTRREARQALIARETSVVSVLVDTLGQVSRIRAHLNPQALITNWSEEIAVYLVAALDDPVGSALFVDLAYLARRLVGQRLNVAAQVSGFLFLPDSLGAEDPHPALARTYAALRELDACMEHRQTRDSQALVWGKGRRDKTWGAAFDGGCYLFGALNGQGLALAGPQERIELAAEALLQLVFSPLGEEHAAPLPGRGVRPQGYGSLGVAAWVYPSRALGDLLARRLAGELFSAWLEAGDSTAQMDQDTVPEAVSLLGEWVAEAGNRLLAPNSLDEVALWRPSAVRLAWFRAGRFQQDLEDEAVGRLEPLAARRSEMDRQAKAEGQEITSQIDRLLARRLNQATPGRLNEVDALLASVERRLHSVRAETQEAADARWKDLEALDGQLERVKKEMGALASRFPNVEQGVQSWPAALALLCSPRQILVSIRAYQALERAGAAYSTLLARQMALAVEVLQRDLLVEVCEGVLDEMQVRRAQVRTLIEAVQEAQQAQQATERPGAEFAAAHPSFGLEISALTPELIEELYATACGELTDRLADLAESDRPLSAWLQTDSDGQSLSETVVEYARRRCSVVDEISVDDLLVRSLMDVRQRSEALRALMALGGPFLGWDETRLQGDEYQTLRTQTIVGLGEGTASPLLEGLDGLRGAQVVATGERQRVTALSLVRGLPLAALAGLEEYAAAYRSADPASLHTISEWRDLPDLLGEVLVDRTASPERGRER